MLSNSEIRCDTTVVLQIFIDRDPVFFSKILNYLRTKEIDLRFVILSFCFTLCL